MKFSELKRLLDEAGCFIKKSGMNHDLYYSPITEKTFPVGRYDDQEVPEGTLNEIINQSGIKI